MHGNMFDKDDCPTCNGRGEQITAYVCFGPNPRHETIECFNCEGTGKLDVYILNKLEKLCRTNCNKHRKSWGDKLFDIGIKWKSEKPMREYQRLKRIFEK